MLSSVDCGVEKFVSLVVMMIVFWRGREAPGLAL